MTISPAHSPQANAPQHCRVRKAILPVGGLGTRFLPATKAMPKEMLTVVDRPLVHYAVDEAFEAGIEQVILVTCRGKAVLEDHFDRAFELEATLIERGKSLETLKSFQYPPGSIVAIRQQEPLGLGHAVWAAHSVIGDEPFAVMLPDELIMGQPGCLKQLVDAHETLGGNLVAVQTVPEDQTNRYGIIAPADPVTAEGALSIPIAGLVEKPAPGTAPSQLAIVGRYILQPELFAFLARHERGQGGEIQLTDAMARLIDTQSFHGVRFTGERYDCGDKVGFAMANLALALSRPDIGDALRPFARAKLGL